MWLQICALLVFLAAGATAQLYQASPDGQEYCAVVINYGTSVGDISRVLGPRWKFRVATELKSTFYRDLEV
eukprot:gene20548-27338_t